MAIAGKGGAAKISTNIITDIGEWSLGLTNDLQDITEFGDTWKSRISGLLDGTGTFSGRWDVGSTQQLACQTGFLAGTSIALRLYVNASNYYSGTAFLKGQTPKANVSGTVDIEWAFEIDGAVTYS